MQIDDKLYIVLHTPSDRFLRKHLRRLTPRSLLGARPR